MLINKNFKNLIFGRVFGNLGDSLYVMSLSWFLIQTTDSTRWVGVFNAIVFAPTLFSFLLGNLIDRYEKKKLLIFFQIGQGLIALLLTILLFFQIKEPVILVLLVGVASSFGMNLFPIADAFTPLLVEKNQLEKAQSIVVASFQVSDYIFNALIGFFLSVFQLFFMLFLSFISFILSILSFKKIAFKESLIIKDEKSNESPKLLDGVRLLFSNRISKYLTIGMIIANIGFSGLSIYILKIANHLDSSLFLGLIHATAALGATIGSTYVSQKLFSHFTAYKKMFVGTLLFGVGMFLSGIFADSFFFLFLFGISSIFLGVTHSVSNPIIQQLFEEEQLGKVFASQATVTVGIMPIGSLIFGWIATYVPGDLFMYSFGLTYILVALLYLLHFPKSV